MILQGQRRIHKHCNENERNLSVKFRTAGNISYFLLLQMKLLVIGHDPIKWCFIVKENISISVIVDACKRVHQFIVHGYSIP